MYLNHYSPDTGFYTHQAPAIQNPKQPGKYFEQAFTTPDPVPNLQKIRSPSAIKKTLHGQYLKTGAARSGTNTLKRLLNTQKQAHCLITLQASNPVNLMNGRKTNG